MHMSMMIKLLFEDEQDNHFSSLKSWGRTNFLISVALWNTKYHVPSMCTHAIQVQSEPVCCKAPKRYWPSRRETFSATEKKIKLHGISSKCFLCFIFNFV